MENRTGDVMKKLYIVQPMNRLTDREIKKTREQAHKFAEMETGEQLEVLETYFQNNAGPLELLGEALKQMEYADYVVFAPDYGLYRGCRIEQKAAMEYEKKCLYMKQ